MLGDRGVALPLDTGPRPSVLAAGPYWCRKCLVRSRSLCRLRWRAIVWAYENPTPAGGPAVLHAYDAAYLSELYNSNQVPQRDQFGEANKFITPTICNGKVFVGTTNSVGVFGLLNLKPVAKDFNGDGQADLVWENTSTGERAIWIMHNGVPAYSITLPTIPIQWHIAGAADFFGTGQADLIWENTTMGERSIWIMRNGVSAYSIALPIIPIQWQIMEH
jgi:hypothetical protein